MPNEPNVCVIVPAFNEEASLPTVVTDLKRHVPEADIVIVDDGSTDNTCQVAGELDVTVLSLPFNLGIGGAVQAGLTYAFRQNYDYAIQFDGDGQHRADQIRAILEPLLSDEADAVIGSRFLAVKVKPSSSLKKVGMTVLRYLVSLAAKQEFSDTTSGFRAYNRRALEVLARHYPQDYPEPESIVDLCRGGYAVREVAVTMRPRTTGRSSIGLRYSLYYMVKVVLATLVAWIKSPITSEENQ